MSKFLKKAEKRLMEALEECQKKTTARLQSMKTIEENLKEHEGIINALKGEEFKLSLINGEYKGGYKYACTVVHLNFNKNGIVKDAMAVRNKESNCCVEIELYRHLSTLEKQLFKISGFNVLDEIFDSEDKNKQITRLRKHCAIYDV